MTITRKQVRQFRKKRARVKRIIKRRNLRRQAVKANHPKQEKKVTHKPFHKQRGQRTTFSAEEVLRGFNK